MKVINGTGKTLPRSPLPLCLLSPPLLFGSFVPYLPSFYRFPLFSFRFFELEIRRENEERRVEGGGEFESYSKEEGRDDKGMASNSQREREKERGNMKFPVSCEFLYRLNVNTRGGGRGILATA